LIAYANAPYGDIYNSNWQTWMGGQPFTPTKDYVVTQAVLPLAFAEGEDSGSDPTAVAYVEIRAGESETGQLLGTSEDVSFTSTEMTPRTFVFPAGSQPEVRAGGTYSLVLRVRTDRRVKYATAMGTVLNILPHSWEFNEVYYWYPYEYMAFQLLGKGSNQFPTITNNGLTLLANGTATITSAHLQAVDPDDPPASTLEFTVIAPPTRGALLENGISLTAGATFTQADIDAGRIEYVHSGIGSSDRFTFTLTDGQGGEVGPATFEITTIPVNDPPDFTPGPNVTVAEDAGLVTRPNWATDITPGPNESYQTVSFIVTADNPELFAVQPAVSTDGTLTFEPAPDRNGQTTVRVQAVDDGGTANGGSDRSAVKSFTITIVAVNDPPVTIDDWDWGTDEDSGEVQIMVNPLVNDRPGPATATDESGQTLELTGVTNGTGGTVRWNGNRIYFTPAPNFYGTATFRYTVRDSEGATATGTIHVPVSPVADPPVVSGARDVDEDGQLTLTVERNAVDGGEVTHFCFDGIEHGKLYRADSQTEITDGYLAVSQASTVIFRPDPDFVGVASFRVRAATSADGKGLSEQTPVQINVRPVNDPPVAVDDTLGSIAEDSGPRTIPFAALLGNDSPGPADEGGQTLTITGVGSPVGGTVAIAGTDVVFTPHPDFTGTASFTYTVTDDGTTDGVPDPRPATATVAFTVTPVNDAPIGVDDVLSPVAEDSDPVVIPFATLLENDRPGPATALDEVNQTLTITHVSSPVGGTVEIVGTDVIFTLAPKFNGTASFTYTLADDGTPAETAQASVSFFVENVAEQPIATGTTTAEDTRSTDGLVITPDPTDVGSVTHFVIAHITGGTLYKNDGVTQIHEDDRITAAEGAAGLRFMPLPDRNSPAGDSFGFTIHAALDVAGTGMSPGTNVAIAVTEVNDAPTGPAVFNGYDYPEDFSGTFTRSLLLDVPGISPGPANEGGQTLSITAIEEAVGGSAAVTPDGISFTATPDYYGPASVRYTVTDNGTTNGVPDPKSISVTLNITITPVPDAPVITDAVTQEDTSTTSGLVVTPNPVDGPEITHFEVKAVNGGQLSTKGGTPLAVGDLITVAHGAGGLTFTPAPDAYGESFSVALAAYDGSSGATGPETTARITVTEVNDDPVAADDTLPAIDEDAAPVPIPAAALTANDRPGPANEDGQRLTVTGVGGATGGEVTLDEDAQVITFRPAPNFHGTASFTYTVTDDGTTNGAADPKRASATVTFTVNPVADEPQITPTTTREDTQSTSGLVITRSAVDGTEVTHFQITGITLGTLYLNDGVTPVADGQFITAAQAGAGLRFTPAPNANSAAGHTFTFTARGATDASGAGLGDPATAEIWVAEVNDPPIAMDDTLPDLPEDSDFIWIPISQLIANDSAGPHEAGQSLSVTAVSNPVGGTVSIEGSSVRFVPTADYHGPASFVYALMDNGTTDGAPDPQRATATVTFTITEVNDPPVAADDHLAPRDEDTGPWTISLAALLANDSPGPGNEAHQSLTVTSVGGPLRGSVAIVGTDVVFTPDPDFNGTASFRYTVTDDGTTNGAPDPQAAVAEVFIPVTPVNDAPVAADQAVSAVVGRAYTGQVRATDVDGDPLTYRAVAGPSNGTLTLNDDGSFVYVGSSAGTDAFTFTANDGTVDSAPATVTITVTAAPPAPAPAPSPRPFLTLSAPVEFTRESSIVVSGSALPLARVSVNGAAVTADHAGQWSATVALAEGPNVITAATEGITQSVTVTRDTVPPQIDLTASASMTDAETVTLTASSEPGAVVEIEGQRVTSLVVPLAMGSNRFTATATDRAGNTATAAVTVVRVAAAPEKQRVDEGQSAEVGTQDFRVTLPGEAVTEPLLLQIASPSRDEGAVLLAGRVALVAMTGDSIAEAEATGAEIHLLAAPATVTFVYDPAKVLNPDALRIYYFDPVQQVWVEVGGTVDPARNQISVQVGHLTTFAAMEPLKEAPALDEVIPQAGGRGLTVTGTFRPGEEVTLVINRVARGTASADENGRFTLTGVLAPGRNFVYVRASGILASREVEVLRQAHGYTDLEAHWAEQYVGRLAEMGAVSLYPEPSFRPEEQVTRLEFAVMIGRILGLVPVGERPSFTDVDTMPEWALPEISASVNAGIIRGYLDGSFRPVALVSRAEMAVMLTRALEYTNLPLTPGARLFTDQPEIPDWALEQVLTAVQYGLITGYPDGSFQAASNTTRAEAATMLTRLLDAIAE